MDSKRLVLIFSMILAAAFATANEGGEGGHGEGEAHAAGGEGHGEGGKKADEKKNPEWVDTITFIEQLNAKIMSKDEDMKKLMEEKQKTTDATRLQEIIDEMKKDFNELKRLHTEYEKKKSYLKYRFPETGLVEERKYERFEYKSLDDFEKKMSLEARTQVVNRRAKHQYGADEAAKPTPATQNPANKDVKDPSEKAMKEPLILRN